MLARTADNVWVCLVDQAACAINDFFDQIGLNLEAAIGGAATPGSAQDFQVNVGDRVEMDQIVARALIPGALHPINVAGHLSIPPADLPQALRVQKGDAINKGQLQVSFHHAV